MPTKLYRQVECAERLPVEFGVYLTDMGALHYESSSRSDWHDKKGNFRWPAYWLEECKPDAAVKAAPEAPRSAQVAQLSESILQYMAEQHPHTVLIATSTSVQLLEAVCSTGEVHKYLKD